MSLLVVGSVALDSIFTPFGETADALLDCLITTLSLSPQMDTPSAIACCILSIRRSMS